MLITAFGSSEIENQARQLGVAFLHKPFGLGHFYAVVQDSLAEGPRPQPAAQLTNEEENRPHLLHPKCGLPTDI
jgi:hypothetical protein